MRRGRRPRTWREIYKGVTANGGANWTWTADHQRLERQQSPADCSRRGMPNHTAVVWFRGTYTTAQNTDAAVVGIIERNTTHSRASCTTSTRTDAQHHAEHGRGN